MKYSVILFSALLLASTIGSASAQTDTPMPKKIEVYGQAEEQVTPDEIYFSVTLKEYEDKENKKTTIDQLEKELYEAVRKIDVAEEDLRIKNVYGYNYHWYREEKPEREDFLASKEYQIKLDNFNDINPLLAALDAKGIQSTNVDRYAHSQIEQFRRDLKIEALKNAKEKAGYLLGGIDEQLGGILEIQEVDTEGDAPPVYYQARTMASASAESASPPTIDAEKIELKFRVRAVFEIK